MSLLLFFIFCVVLTFSINFFFLKNNFLLDKKILPHKSFISKNTVPLTAGFLMTPSLFFFYSKEYIIFFIFIFILGIVSDLLIIKSPAKKIIIQFSIIFFFIIITGLRISSTKVLFIDDLIKNNFFATIFTIFCLLILINGSNFLDGLNTLVVGYYILVTLVVIHLVSFHHINYNVNFFQYLLISLFVIFIFNFFSKIYLGDSGVFLLSLIVGSELITLSNANLYTVKFISPLFIVLLLWYPAFENLFSIVRRSYNKIHPTHPDNKHLHQLIFTFVKKNIINNNFTNSISAIIINFYNLIVFLIGLRFISSSISLSYLLIINILVYIFCYQFFLKKNKT